MTTHIIILRKLRNTVFTLVKKNKVVLCVLIRIDLQDILVLIVLSEKSLQID